MPHLNGVFRIKCQFYAKRFDMKHVLWLAFTLVFISASGQDKKLKGIWDNGTGQILVFQGDNQALWIFYQESKRDTFKIKYSTDFKSKPYKLDLTDFTHGPLKGKTLYGILDYTDKKTIKFDCEPGTTPDVRPREFNPEQTQTYKKKAPAKPSE